MVALPVRHELFDTVQRARLDELEALHREHRASRHRFLMPKLLGAWLRRQKRATASPLPDVGRGEVGVTWAGHASVRIRYANLSIVCDPMLESHLGLFRRLVMPGLSYGELQDVDLILIGNADADHLHRPTLARLPRSATIVVPPRCAGLVSDLGFARVVELGLGQSVSQRGVDVFSTSVRHTTSHGRGACAYVLRGDGPSVFFCGDSGYFSGFAEVGQRHRPDVACLPIGGWLGLARATGTFRADHMSPLDALYAFEDLGARMLVPIHHGAFPLSYERLDEPRRWLDRLVDERDLEDYVATLEPGESRKFALPRATVASVPATPAPAAVASVPASPAPTPEPVPESDTEKTPAPAPPPSEPPAS